MRLIMYSTLAAVALLGPAKAADYSLKLEQTGMRDYYCTMTVSLSNLSDTSLTEINGYFLSFIDGERIGRSKGTSFLNVAAGSSVSAVFETPNSPCADATAYTFVVGACRIGSGFEAQSVCAAALTGEGRIDIDLLGS